MRRAGTAGSLALALVASTAVSAVAADVALQTVQRYVEAGQAQSVAIGDLDGDGRRDVAVGSGLSSPDVHVYLQQPDRTLLGQRVELPAQAQRSEPVVAVLDLDADGRGELLAGVGDAVYVFGREAGAWRVQQQVGLGDVYKVTDLLVLDWDGDGDRDLFVPVSRLAESTGKARWLRNDAGVLSAQDPGGVDARDVVVTAVGELDGDGRPELVGHRSYEVVVQSRSADGSWSLARYPTQGMVAKVAVGDVTGDGRADLLATTDGVFRERRYALEVLPQRTGGGFGPPLVHPSWENVDAVVVADLNGDERLDVVVNHEGYDAIGVYQQAGDGTLQTERRFSWFGGSGSHDLPSGLQVADVDSDARPDVLLASDNHGLQVMRQGPAPTRCEPPFADVAADHPFCSDIAWMKSARISNGTTMPDGSVEYRPSAFVSRAAMAPFLYRALGSPEFTSPVAQSFDDVSPSHPFFKEIEWMNARGISTGTAQPGSRPLYKPADAVSRQAMAAFLYRAAGQPPFRPPATASFADVATTDDFFTVIEWLKASGISTGTPQPNGRPLYKPADAVSRQAMAAFLHRFDGQR